jgi:hypothetical protein
VLAMELRPHMLTRSGASFEAVLELLASLRYSLYQCAGSHDFLVVPVEVAPWWAHDADFHPV